MPPRSPAAASAPISPRDRMIVALDLPDADAAWAMVERLGDAASFYKVGMELAYGGGMGLIERLIGSGRQVFLDVKLHDIPNTVARATAQVARLGVRFLTVHAYPQTMRAAVEGRGDSSLEILAVTVMTSYDDADLREAGFAAGVRDTVATRAVHARDIGIDGLVLSAEEARSMRTLVGPRMALVTPGIRPVGAALGDQKRAMSPGEAITAGADYLVIGRPITTAADPRQVAEVVTRDIATALA